MIDLMSRLVRWGLLRKPLRTFFLLLTVVGSLSSFAFTEAVMRDLMTRTVATWRSSSHDMTVVSTKVPELEGRIAALQGVRKTECIFQFQVVIGPGEVAVAVAALDSDMLGLTLLEGREPSSDHEIAVGESIASLQGLKLGDEVRLSTRLDIDRIVPYTVVGVIRGSNLLTEDGARRIHKELERFSTLLILLDGSRSSTSIERDIRSLYAGVTIKNMDQSHMFYGPTSIAESLIRLTRWLLLGVGVTSLYMLIILSQQERAYELGVLRALGFSRGRVMSTLVIEGTIILLLGGCVAFLVLLMVATVFNIGRWNALLLQYLPGAGVVLGLGLTAVFWTAREFARKPITILFKG